MPIKLGPAGIPTICKTRATIEGVKATAQLGLQAMEVEFSHGVNMKPEVAEEVGVTANDVNVQLSIHAPYFINLCSSERSIVKASITRIMDSARLGEKMKAKIIAIHAGYYKKLSHEEAYETVKTRMAEVFDAVRSEGIRGVNLGLETTGRVSQFGTLDEIISLSKTMPCVPYVDFAHIYARQGGHVNYAEILNKLESLRLPQVYIHFSGIRWMPTVNPNEGNEKNHEAIRNGKPPFESLAKELLARQANATIICESPLLERDSLVMKRIFQKLGYKF